MGSDLGEIQYHLWWRNDTEKFLFTFLFILLAVNQKMVRCQAANMKVGGSKGFFVAVVFVKRWKITKKGI